LKADKDLRFLRRTVRPYVGQSAIIFIVAIYALFVSAKTGDWGFMLPVAVALVSFLYLVAIGLKYKNGNGVRLRMGMGSGWTFGHSATERTCGRLGG
jgi:hypothetical protein